MNKDRIYARRLPSLPRICASLTACGKRRLGWEVLFWERYRRPLESERASRAEMDAYQGKQIERMVRLAYDIVSYYGRSTPVAMAGLPVLHRKVECNLS